MFIHVQENFDDQVNLRPVTADHVFRRNFDHRAAELFEQISTGSETQRCSDQQKLLGPKSCPKILNCFLLTPPEFFKNLKTHDDREFRSRPENPKKQLRDFFFFFLDVARGRKHWNARVRETF